MLSDREKAGYKVIEHGSAASNATVRKYIQMKDCPALVRHTTKELIRKV